MKKIKNNLSLIILLLISLLLIYINFDNLKISFLRTVIEEKRYLLFVEGLLKTLLISFSSIIIGSLGGFIICYLNISKRTNIKKIVSFVIYIIQGTPITVLLLIFYYVIFGKININPLFVAIICFSFYFSIYVSEIYRAALYSINKNQILTAYSMGFTKVQTFFYIILPQSMIYAIPVFKNEVVSLIKLTSICGFISIMDVTKAGDIIRNRTYEAFFPLIMVAILYYLICLLAKKLLDILYCKFNYRSYIGGNKDSSKELNQKLQ
ncbi:MAG: amino acid ABC transporter permease [Bacilli bacterium]